MARTAITNNILTANAGNAPTSTAIDATNGMNLAIATSAIPAAADVDTLVLIVTNSAGASKTVTIRAGVGGGATAGPAFRSGIGDLVVTIATTATSYIGPLDPSRFVQLDGSINVDFAASTTGTILPVILPTRF